MGASGREVSARVASMPSIPGMFTSISTRSGRNVATAINESSPDAADPTTVKPCVSSTTAAIAPLNSS
jgi:hypothetical protein